MPPRYAHVWVPVVGVLVSGAAMMTLGSPREVHGVRVFGGATNTPAPNVIHLVYVVRDVGVDMPKAVNDLRVTVDNEQFTVNTNDDGFAEITLQNESPASGRTIRVTRNNKELVRGTVNVATSTWHQQTLRLPTAQRVATANNYSLTAHVDAGALWLNQWTLVWVKRLPGSTTPATLRAVANGAETQHFREIDGGWQFEVRASFTTVSIDLFEGEQPIGELRLPVRTAAYAIDEAIDLRTDLTHNAPVTVRSSSGRKKVFASAQDETGIRAVSSADLLTDPKRGGSAGLLSLPLWTAPHVLVLSAEPGEVGSASMLLPRGFGSGPVEAFASPTRKWLDGVAPAAQSERERINRVIKVVIGFIAAITALEVVLLLERFFTSQRVLDEHLRAASDGAIAESTVQEQHLGWKIAVVVAGVAVALLGAGIIWMASVG